MNYIKHVKISNFWGNRDISLDFEEDINFLIGVNGSGKTTVINLIRAALQGDARTLSHQDFNKLEIGFASKENRRLASVKIEKDVDSMFGFLSNPIKYSVKQKATENPVEFLLDEDGDMYWLSGEEEELFAGTTSSRSAFNKRHGTRAISNSSKRLLLNRDRVWSHETGFSNSRNNIYLSLLNEIAKVSWLSINRINPLEDTKETGSTSSVDRKLNQLSIRLARYFSSLSTQSSKKLVGFQESIFLSMLVNDQQDKLAFRTELNLVQEKKVIEDIFSQFKLDKKVYTGRINKHFSILKKAINNINIAHDNVTESPMRAKDIEAIILHHRVDSLLEEWRQLDSDRAKIFEPRDTFLKIINNLLQRKELYLDERNELCVTTQSGKELPLTMLSSGEKQLLIVLGEALIQEKSSWIYIADEPELSLHVNWQESLVDDLKRINPNAQIIFATHSPDVVGAYGDKVIDMEKKL